jgi:hypothetical protein
MFTRQGASELIVRQSPGGQPRMMNTGLPLCEQFNEPVMFRPFQSFAYLSFVSGGSFRRKTLCEDGLFFDKSHSLSLRK